MKMEVEEYDVTGYINNQVTLNFTPSSAADVAVDPIGGPAQVLGIDFVVEGKILKWDLPNSDIKQVVDDGYPVVLRVIYEHEGT